MIEPILYWIAQNEWVLWLVSLSSVALLLISAIVVPTVIVSLPSDYFLPEQRDPVYLKSRNRVVQLGISLLRNLLGLLFVVLGIAMLILPGQGLLTLLVGCMFLDFPGKYQIERAFMRLSAVRAPVNWIRSKAGKEPLQL